MIVSYYFWTCLCSNHGYFLRTAFIFVQSFKLCGYYLRLGTTYSRVVSDWCLKSYRRQNNLIFLCLFCPDWIRKNLWFKIIFGITGKDFIQNWILQNIANLDDISHILQPSWFKTISDYQFWIVEFCLGIHSAKFICYSRTSASAGNVKLHLISCDKWEESKIVAVAWKVEPMQGLWLEWPVNNSFTIPDHTSKY